jgi:hypothetical protein
MLYGFFFSCIKHKQYVAKTTRWSCYCSRTRRLKILKVKDKIVFFIFQNFCSFSVFYLSFFNFFLVSLHISFLTFVFPLMKGYFWDPNYLLPVISDLGCFKIWLSNSYFYGVVWLILHSIDFYCLFFIRHLIMMTALTRKQRE